MIRTFKYPLLPNKTQEAVLSTWLEACRSLYNGALQDRQNAYDKDKSTLSYYDQTAELTKMRARLPALKEVPVEVARSALRHLDRAFQAFFRRSKSGETPGYPRYKGKGRVRSFNIGCARTEGQRVIIPKLGPVKFNLYREIQGRAKELRISRVAGKWFVCFACELGEAPAKTVPITHVGIDLGLTDFVTLSDGSTIGNPRFFQRSEEALARTQRALERKKRGSNNRKKAKLQVQRAHQKIRNQRLDFARKTVVQLFHQYDQVSYEDLKIDRMVSGNFAKSIHDAGWGVFIHALQCKAEYAGKWAVAVNPRNTTATCSGCGKIVKKKLWERIHTCEDCKLTLKRDHNAAIVVDALGRSAVPGGNSSSTEALRLADGPN